jgi:hypothetical protein
VRSASATWQVITDLIADTVAVAPACDRSEVEAAMTAAAAAGRMLVAGGHLDRHPVVFIAGTVHCEITTVSGTDALDHDENLNVIPGAAAATTFTVHLPAPEPMAKIVADAVALHPRLSDAAGPTEPSTTATSGASLVDTEALRKAVATR